MIALWHRLPANFEDQLQLVAGRAQAYHFDDGHDDVLRAADGLESCGLRGVFFVVTEWMGCPGYATAAQIGELIRRGHEVGNHTASHPIMNHVSLAEARDEIDRAQCTLAGIVPWPRRFAWPHGLHNADLDQVAAEFRFVETRDIANVVRNIARKSPAQIRSLFP